MHVSTIGARLFRFRYRFDGKEKEPSFGQYPDISLAQARELCDNARKSLAQGINPPAQKKATGTAIKETFEAVFNEWLLIRVKSLSDSRPRRGQSLPDIS